MRWDDFGRILMTYEVWQFKLEIYDPSDKAQIHEGPGQSLRSCSNTGSFFIRAPFQSFTSFLIVCYITVYVSSKGAKLLANKVDIQKGGHCLHCSAAVACFLEDHPAVPERPEEDAQPLSPSRMGYYVVDGVISLVCPCESMDGWNWNPSSSKTASHNDIVTL